MRTTFYKNFLLAFLLAIAIGCATTAAIAQTRVVVTGEDSNKNSVERTDEVFRRVISQIQESMSRSGYQVIDEDMLGVKLGFSFNSRRPKTELIETLMLANETEDATVQSRLAVVFAIFPQIKTMSVSKKLEVRIRGEGGEKKMCDLRLHSRFKSHDQFRCRYTSIYA